MTERPQPHPGPSGRDSPPALLTCVRHQAASWGDSLLHQLGTCQGATGATRSACRPTKAASSLPRGSAFREGRAGPGRGWVLLSSSPGGCFQGESCRPPGSAHRLTLTRLSGGCPGPNGLLTLVTGTVTIAFRPQLLSSVGQKVTFEAKVAGSPGSLPTCTVTGEAPSSSQPRGTGRPGGGAWLLQPVALSHGDEALPGGAARSWRGREEARVHRALEVAA